MHNTKILVPTDFSLCSKNALTFAIKMAKKMDAKLILMHAFQVPVSSMDAGAEAYFSESITNIKDNIKKEFDIFKETPEELKEVEHDILIKHDLTKNAILSACESTGCKLIVMGTHGARGLDEILIGSNTYSVMKESVIPVLAIPESARMSDIKRIAFAGDYKSIEDKNVLQTLIQLTKAFNAEINIVHIDPDEEAGLSDSEINEAKKFEQYFKHVRHTYHFIHTQNIEAGLEDYAQNNDIDLIALIPRKHKFLDNLSQKRISKKLAFHSKVPILALK
ncbi:MAG: universal stress protein [Cytophagales bacterium]|nr:universal stress protein [Cytophagales bacterium]